ncbi:hypothetical protein OG905_00580 [Streptomyces sp. NBC_00322]|uniref:hypothetical protein n=1 Tax=Streptomyces sp. NBC_00322 TaxID=2975712 RepID=UPI002E2A38F6|nr:hypothetical protein [Streptomyces sp. NBC_00322]
MARWQRWEARRARRLALARGLVSAREQRAAPVTAELSQPMAPGYSSGTAAVDRLIAGA